MTPLDRRIREEIGAEGPMRLDRFWNLCLFDPAEGYYTQRDPFGAAGDFVTAPGVSQMFGELVGAWLVAAWRAIGSPSPVVLAEGGPGDGTLIQDVLRTVRRLDPALMRALRPRLVERSDRLAARQIERLAAFDLPVRRVREIRELDAAPTLLVANELLDAVAIRQFEYRDGSWGERFVTVDETGALRFARLPPRDGLPAALTDPRAPPPGEGHVFETSPERDQIVADMATHLASQGGAALLFDYGHLRTGYGDTLQALKAHRAVSPLAECGRVDITSHVDFAQARRVALARGCAGAAMAQGAFLLALGLRERAGVLGAGADEAGREGIVRAARRLAGEAEGEMGALFKALALSPRPLPLPPFAVPGA
ncbi:class I SAM-dependent methyltransferase [Aureimonas sp. AU4]|uniref:class I SAM-dependent methyltransferase n=1 Tax=Aureimonas sp. AU4 TaxID=1638163 RepID=UPI0007842826|nr:SAM-dependent methyltransferase [Aureimonas sp. AU4]